MFIEVITKVHVYWFPFYLKVLLFQSIMYPIKEHVYGFVRFCLMVPLMMPSAVELSVMISVAYCGCPISFRVVLSALSSLEFQNNSPHSASAANEFALRTMVNMTIIAPFSWLLSSFVLPIQKNFLLCFLLVITKNTIRHYVL